MKKTFGILALLILVFLATAYMAESFLTPFNLENLIRRTSLFGIISIGVAFVIITGGIDLSIGSVICLIGCGLPFLLQVDYQPRQQATLTEINAAQATVTLSAPANFSRGDQLHLSDSTAKNTGVYKIKSARGNTLTLEPAPREDDQRGRIVQVFPIAQRKAKAKSITAEAGLAARDQVTFVNANGNVGLTAKIQSTQGHEYSLSEAAPDDAQFFIALHRHPRTSVPVALALVLLVSLGIGLSHGYLVAKIKLQPFVVTLCGLLLYRGLTRGFTEDQTQGFQAEYPDLRLIATAKFGALDYAQALGLFGGLLIAAGLGWLWWQRKKNAPAKERRWPLIPIALGAGIIAVWLAAGNPAGWDFPVAIGIAAAAAMAGFLVWNRHPARIFLGDVGSIPLGFLLGAALLDIAGSGALEAAVILPLYYLADATITLTRRLFRGEKVWLAHREHFYQRAANENGRGPVAVVTAITLCNLGLVFAAIWSVDGIPGVGLAIAAVLVAGTLFHLNRRPGS